MFFQISKRLQSLKSRRKIVVCIHITIKETNITVCLPIWLNGLTTAVGTDDDDDDNVNDDGVDDDVTTDDDVTVNDTVGRVVVTAKEDVEGVREVDKEMEEEREELNEAKAAWRWRSFSARWSRTCWANSWWQ